MHALLQVQVCIGCHQCVSCSSGHCKWPQVLVPPRKLAEEHYQEHAGEPFYPGLVTFLSSGAVVAMVWEGDLQPSSAQELACLEQHMYHIHRPGTLLHINKHVAELRSKDIGRYEQV